MLFDYFRTTHDCFIQTMLGKFAFPDYNHPPSRFFQFSMLLPVTRHIPLELRRPELHVGLRHCGYFATLVTMPEAAVNEDDRVPLGQHDVWMSGQFGGMEAVAESQGMQMAAHKHLRLRVLRPNPAHRVAALLWGYFVHERKTNGTRYGTVLPPSPCSCHQEASGSALKQEWSAGP